MHTLTIDVYNTAYCLSCLTPIFYTLLLFEFALLTNFLFFNKKLIFDLDYYQEILHIQKNLNKISVDTGFR